MSFLINNGIPESDLPVKSPSGAAMLRYVEDGKSYSGSIGDVIGPIDDRINVLEISQGDGVPGVANYSDIATLFPSPTAGQQVDVLTDPDPSKVGRWGYIGGVWVKSADRVSVLEQTTERIVEGDPKNLFDPAQVITGYWYSATGAQANNAIRRVTPRIALGGATKVTISGVNADLMGMTSSYALLNFWNGTTHVMSVKYPTTDVNMSEMVLDVPAGATAISLNLPDTSKPIPDRLQVEIGGKATKYEPRRRPQTALPESTFDNLHFEVSGKNLFDGRMFTNRALTGTQITITGNNHFVATSFIPVEPGKTYTVSGLDPNLVSHSVGQQVLGFPQPGALPLSASENFGAYGAEPFTFTVSDPATKYIAIQTSRDAGRYMEAYTLQVQVEEGSVATAYEPHRIVRGVAPSLAALDAKLSARIDNGLGALTPAAFRSLEVTGAAGQGVTAKEVSRDYAPYGAAYRINAEPAEDAVGNTLFLSAKGLAPGAKSIYAVLSCGDSSGAVTLPKIAVKPFSVPSRQMLGVSPSTSPADDYAHPAIAYSAAGVGGYKYWMVASILPRFPSDGALWEDEDIFVSNDAKTWLRIKSAYEVDSRPEHAPGFVLPPHDLESVSDRRFGFLPCPRAGDTIEISAPANNGGAELDRVNVTLSGLPWKHDPAILIDGGYVYIYHSFHLSYPGRPGGSNRFIVCTRTNDGVNWECVRSDGSTLPLNTAAASRQMFTKDGSGRYNFLAYFYNMAGSNPEVIKYGAGDYEFVYGENFSLRYAGTSPWSFDFGTVLPMQGIGSGNHPGLLYAGGNLYLLNQNGLFQSANRGQTFTQLAFYPSWRGGPGGSTYKKAMSVGEGGKVIVVDVHDGRMPADGLPVGSQFKVTQRRMKMLVQEFASLASFTGSATGGLNDGYIDVQIDQLNYDAGTRRTDFIPYVGNDSGSALANNPHQLVKVADVVVADGDTFYFYVSLTARSGGRVSFNGLEIR